MGLKLLFLLLACVLSSNASADSSCNEKYCLPQNGDLSVGRVLQVTGSCNNSILCTSDDSYLNDRDADTDWVSEPGQQNATIQVRICVPSSYSDGYANVCSSIWRLVSDLSE